MTRDERRAQLEAELEKLNQEQREEEQERVNQARQNQLANIDVLIGMTTHDWNGRCSDEKPSTKFGNCKRCTLLEVKAIQYWPEGLSVTLDVYYQEPHKGYGE